MLQQFAGLRLFNANANANASRLSRNRSPICAIFIGAGFHINAPTFSATTSFSE